MLIWDARERLSEAHDLSEFACGESAIDSWLATNLQRYVERDMCSVWVCPEPGSTKVMGLFTLTAASVDASDLPRKQRAGQSGRHGAVLLGQIALRSDLRGKGLGQFLMLEAFAQCHESGIGTRFVVLDALNSRLVKYYEEVGFRPLAGTRDGARMFLPMTAVRAALAAALAPAGSA